MVETATTQTANVSNVFHNAETGRFEATVVLRTTEVQHAFDVTVEAPITTDFDVLRPALIAEAKAQLAKGDSDLKRSKSMLPMPNRTKAMLARILAAQPRYLDEILSRAA